jgi:RNA polymerase sigma-70 factor (family 1)
LPSEFQSDFTLFTFWHSLRRNHLTSALPVNLQYDEKKLLEHIAAGDTAAFETLYQMYWQELFSSAARMLRSEEEAADVLQDVFLSLWNRRSSLAIEGSLAAYLHSSVRYKVRDSIARNIVRKDYLSILADTAVNTLPPTSQLRLELIEVQQTIHATVEKMPERMREAYKLNREQHLSYAEVGKCMGIAPETARKHVQVALDLIKTALGESGLALIISLWMQD